VAAELGFSSLLRKGFLKSAIHIYIYIYIYIYIGILKSTIYIYIYIYTRAHTHTTHTHTYYKVWHIQSMCRRSDLCTAKVLGLSLFRICSRKSRSRASMSACSPPRALCRRYSSIYYTKTL